MFDIDQLDPETFQHLVNRIALRVLGPGLTTFCSGADGGRDGYFEGKAPYPSEADQWEGVWYIQSKFHRPHLSTDAQKWLQKEIKEEIGKFKASPDRVWPDMWIVISNIDPSATPATGTFDKSRADLTAANPALANRFHIWGRAKIYAFLDQFPDIADRYLNIATPSNIIRRILDSMSDELVSTKAMLRALIVAGIESERVARVNEAGDETDWRPDIHKVFVDIPFRTENPEVDASGHICSYLAMACAENHQDSSLGDLEVETNSIWNRHPSRAPVWFIKAGPGQGKSTISQFLAQVHRSALVLDNTNLFKVSRAIRMTCQEIRTRAQDAGLWPSSPRVPKIIDLKVFARWRSSQTQDAPVGVLSFLASEFSRIAEETISVRHIRRLLSQQRWLFVFDGLDEVPSADKDQIAADIRKFIAETRADADAFFVCTSRPQGYSGQFDAVADVATIALSPLNAEDALSCAQNLLSQSRTKEHVAHAMDVLQRAFSESGSIRDLMTTPLQVHIMCIIVITGERPPERRWQLFDRFYTVMRIREANRHLPDPMLDSILNKDAKLLKRVHERLGFVLHARSEKAEGADAELRLEDFRLLVRGVVVQHRDIESRDEIDEYVSTVISAARDRLVLISTPTHVDSFRFDLRQLQEFFASEFIYHGQQADELRQRLRLVIGDQHWREVVHFVLSAFVERELRTEIDVAIALLLELDGSAPDERSIVDRDLARGSGVVGRLIHDGVLDDNKAIRNLFGSMLPGLYRGVNSYDIDLLSACLTKDRAWLKRAMLEYTESSVDGESFGALCVLWDIISDEDQMAGRVEARFGVASSLTLSDILERSEADEIFPSDDYSDQQWKIRCIKTRLSGTEPTRELLMLGRTAFNHSLQKEILPSTEFGRGRKSEDSTLARVNIASSIITVSRRGMTENARADMNSALGGDETTGVFGVWTLAECCTRSPSRDAYIAFLERIPSIAVFEWAQLLPRLLRPPLPGDLTTDSGTLARQIREMSDAEFAAKFQEEYWSSYRITRGPRSHAPLSFHGILPEDFARRFPGAGLELWCGVLGDASFEMIEEMKKTTSALLNALPHSIHLLSRLSYPLQVKIFEARSSLATEFLLYWEASGYGRPSTSHYGVIRRTRSGQDVAFTVTPSTVPPSMKDDPRFLAPVLAGIVERTLGGDSDGRSGEASEAARRNLRDQCKSFSSDVSYGLSTVLDDPSALPWVRASALLFMVFQEEIPAHSIPRSQQLFADAFEQLPWLGILFGEILFNLAYWLGNESYVVLGNALVAERRSGRQNRFHWEQILQRWRERSEEPVSRQGAHLLTNILPHPTASSYDNAPPNRPRGGA